MSYEEIYKAARFSRDMDDTEYLLDEAIEKSARDRFERAGFVTDTDEMKGRVKGMLPGTAATLGGAGLGYAGLSFPSRDRTSSSGVRRSGAAKIDAAESMARFRGASRGRAALAGLKAAPKSVKAGGALMLGGTAAGVVGAHRGGNKARRAKGKSERNVFGFPKD